VLDRNPEGGFHKLVNGSSVTLKEVIRRAPSNWYVEANETLKLRLIAEILLGCRLVRGWNPRREPSVLVPGRFEEMAMRWRSTADQTDAMFGTGHDSTLYTAGWTISGVATIATVVAVWLLGI
jgi:hypothetical protein